MEDFLFECSLLCTCFAEIIATFASSSWADLNTELVSFSNFFEPEGRVSVFIPKELVSFKFPQTSERF